MMCHRHFFDYQSDVVDEYGHKTVNAIESWNNGKHLSLENAKIAASICEIHAQHRLPCRARNRRGDTTHPIVRPPGPHAANHIAICQKSQHARQISGVVLKIAIERRENLPVTGPKPRPERGALSKVLRMPNGAQAWKRLSSAKDLLPGIIAAGVIDEDQFNASRKLSQRRENAFRQRKHVRAFVA
jgi:hypothetical protein